MNSFYCIDLVGYHSRNLLIETVHIQIDLLIHFNRMAQCYCQFYY